MSEILAPVGDFEGLGAALQAGADAVYFGIKGLNMRSGSAKNFIVDDLETIASTCSAHNVRTYLTLNTIVYNHELPRVRKILEKVKNTGIDAVIATDFAVINMARDLEIEVHISTQASISNVESAKFYARYARRLILSRECTLEQISRIKSQLDREGIQVTLEVFVHGALCVAESGRCFMSQYHNRISADRGQCLQECRKEYKIVDLEDPRRSFILDNQFVMSPKDLCALPILDRLMEAGIEAFKIEGRAKGPEYIYTVTRVYQEAVRAVEEGTFTKEKINEWLDRLQSVFNRGFTTNFLLGTPTNDSWAGIYGSRTSAKKVFIGRITNYFKKKGVAQASITNHGIKVNDIIAIAGPTTGYLETEVSSLRQDNIAVTETQGSDVTFPVPGKVRRNDRIFRITKINRTEAELRIDEYDVHVPFKTVKEKP